MSAASWSDLSFRVLEILEHAWVIILSFQALEFAYILDLVLQTA